MSKIGNIKTPGHAPDCKGTPHYYDGCLGYEAMRCDVCGYEQDLNAEANAKATAEREAREQGQHSPLPWQVCDRSYHTYVLSKGLEVCEILAPDRNKRVRDAKLIVASVNNAGKLAEALRRIAYDPIGKSDATHREVLEGIENIAREALARWESEAGK